VRSGNFVYFDTQTHTIGPDHIMASGALPPGFLPIEIEGEQYAPKIDLKSQSIEMRLAFDDPFEWSAMNGTHALGREVTPYCGFRHQRRSTASSTL
jgi:hypothetical protein